MDTQLINSKFNALPEALQCEAIDFIDFLLTKTKEKKQAGQFTFSWEGELSEFKEKHDSVELQHQSMDWR